MPETETLILRLIADNKDLKKKLKETGQRVDALDDKVKKTGKGSGKALGAMAIGWAAVAAAVLKAAQAVFRFSKDAVAAASNFEEANAKFKTVFRGVTVRAIEMREELVNAYAQSRTEATRFLAAAQDLFVPLGLTRDRAAELSGEVVKLAADIGSFNKLPTGDVMRDIQSALVGNFETVRKYGVVLSAATIKQEALNRGLTKTGEELDAQTKALVALQLIQEGSADAVGDMIRTGDSFANTLKKLRAMAEDFMVVIGEELIEEIKPTINAIAKFVKQGDNIDKLRDAVQRVIAGFKLLVNVLTIGVRAFLLIGQIMAKAIIGVIETVRDLAGAWEALMNREFKKSAELAGAAISKNWSEMTNSMLKDVKRFGSRFESAYDNLLIVARGKNDEIIKSNSEVVAAAAEDAKHAQELIDENIEKELDKLRAKHEQEILMFRAAQALEMEERKKGLEFLLKVAKESLNKAFGFAKKRRANQMKNDIQAADKTLKKELAAIDLLSVSETQKDKLRAAAEKKAAMEKFKIQKAAWKSEKKLAITQAVINTALAIGKTMGSVGFPFNLVASALVGTLAAVEVNTIRSQPAPSPPGFQAGGVAGIGGPQIIRVGEAGAELVLTAGQTAQLAALAGGDTNNSLQVGDINVSGAGSDQETGEIVRDEITKASDALGRSSLFRG